MSKKYRYYFQINESFFPAVNEDVIGTQPDVWKSYYPHDSFIRLMNQTKNVLTRSQRLSIWVEGAYGTGKSHAVLTLKKLLDCSNEELKEYFDKYNSVLSKDLYNDFYSIKNQDKKVLTVHRYGSSDVRNDRILMSQIQESIIDALKSAGYTYFGQIGIKQAIIDWLSIDANRIYFNSIIQSDNYRAKFGNQTADLVLENLKNYTSDKAVQDLVEKISEVGEDARIIPFVLKKEDLKIWITDVIEKNNLKAIFFIWDEFSDYFDINKGNLSGFQYLAEMSETYPFYFAIVTHKSEIFFENSRDDVKTKINGRFISPHCYIELPDNMAFVLTGHAMQKVNNSEIIEEWNDIVDDLYELTHNSRQEVIKTAKIGEKELKGVLPIHPYAALILKHIANAFDSNQRSMFDFIKNNRGEEIKGFQWFIDNYGPEDDDEALLTVDLLWDFFYEKGKEQLAPQIRSILDVFGRSESHNLSKQEKRVLKTILLLQAINEKVGDSVELFVPNSKNIGLAFEGTDIMPGNADSIAKNLVKEQIIFERPLGNGKTKYSALVSSGSTEEIEKEKERLKKEIRTDKLIEEGEFINDFRIPRNLEIRYQDVRLLTYENIKMHINNLKSISESHPTRLFAAFTFGRNSEESQKIRSEIQKTFDDNFKKVIFIDYSSEYLNDDLFDRYITNKANCNYYKQKDALQSKSYDKNAIDALKQWKSKVRGASAKVFSYFDQIGTVYNSDLEINTKLRELDDRFFPLALETHVNVIDNMYASNAQSLGAYCGITRDIKGTYKSSNDNTKLEKQFEGVWNLDNYWIVKPNELLSKIKNTVENKIKESFDKNSRVSIKELYDVLIDEPYGFMPCNLSAFVLGFVLKEYANDSYNWSDELTTVQMSVDKMKEMIDEVLKQQQNPSSKYREKYIVEMSPEQREFNKSTAYVFGINEELCTSIENTRSRVRSALSSYKFPIWTLKYCDIKSETGNDIIVKLVDLYVELVNNSSSSRSETDIALEIGLLYKEHASLSKDFKNVLLKENFIIGMKKYLEHYEDGKLISLAKEIGDTGHFIDEISNKFSEATNWVWNKDTVDEKIDETIIEYEIVSESNKLIIKSSTYIDCLQEWSKKCDMFRVSFNSIKKEVGSISELLEYLYHIKKNYDAVDSDKKGFLASLKRYSSDFKSFCAEQITLLKKVCQQQLSELSDDDVSEIASKYLNNVFTLENNEFLSKVGSEVDKYKANMAKYKLEQLWKEKTNTDSPLIWSGNYSMPILCMISPEEQYIARDVFETIISKSNDKNKIEEAIEYLNKYDKYDELNNQTIRDECFKNVLLKNYSVVIDNIEEIKASIKKQFPMIHPYYWLGNGAIESFVKSFALKNYNDKGVEKVDTIIDSMSADDLKKYLKQLIKDNMIVGIEIINNKK